MTLKSELKALGLEEADSEIKPRIILALSGREKSGKTHFALTAPTPSAYLNFDIGDEGVIDKFTRQGKDIFHRRFKKPVTFNKAGDMESKDAQSEWIDFSTTWYKLLDVRGLRTIILDTETEAWELCRLARLGKLVQVRPHHYGPVNAEYNAMLKAAYELDKNIIFIDKVKREYKNESWTGKYERAGFTDLGFIVQVLARVERLSDSHPDLEDMEDPEERMLESFRIRVEECRQNPVLRDAVFPGFMCSFPFLAASVLPDTDPGDWE